MSCYVMSCMQAYQNGIRRCMSSIPLWRSSARLEEKLGSVGKARAILEQARLKNPKQDELWLAAVHTEQRSGNTKAADALMAKALQVCDPDSPPEALVHVYLQGWLPKHCAYWMHSWPKSILSIA